MVSITAARMFAYGHAITRPTSGSPLLCEGLQSPSRHRLQWWRHDGRANGSNQWAPGSGSYIGTGWTLVREPSATPG